MIGGIVAAATFFAGLFALRLCWSLLVAAAEAAERHESSPTLQAQRSLQAAREKAEAERPWDAVDYVINLWSLWFCAGLLVYKVIQ